MVQVPDPRSGAGDDGVTELESLALLIADLNAQLRAAQAENAELRKALDGGE